jgi:hypothetical protein
MWTDPIVEEVRKTREQIFSEFDYDMKKYSAYINETQKKEKRKIVTLEDIRNQKQSN